MIIDCIGCTHGFQPKLRGGDLLIVTGDVTRGDTLLQHTDFCDWLVKQKYEHKILISGNHDNLLEKNPNFYSKTPVKYLCDSGTDVNGFKVWGSPWTSRFPNINPHCCAFTGKDDNEIAPHFENIPTDVDILITHGPPFAIRDLTDCGHQVGSVSLMVHHIQRLRPKLWVFSHVHEAYGEDGPYKWSGTRYVNCSIMNSRYKPINAPIRIEL